MTDTKQVYLLYEGFYNGREVKERLEYVALSSEDATAWVHAPYPEPYSRTSIPISVFERRAGTVQPEQGPFTPSASAAQSSSVPATTVAHAKERLREVIDERFSPDREDSDGIKEDWALLDSQIDTLIAFVRAEAQPNEWQPAEPDATKETS